MVLDREAAYLELQDWVAVLRRRWWLIVLPILAAAAVVGLTLSRPPTYRSKATVTALAVTGGGPASQYSGTSGAKSFVANFQAALVSPPTVEEVVRTTGVTRARLLKGLSSAPVGESTIIEVTYRTTSRAKAAPVAAAAATATMTFLFRSQMDLAQGPLADAEAQLVAVDQELADFTAKASTPVPDRDYEVLANQISALQNQAAQAAATAQPIVAERLNVEIKAKQQQQAQLATTLAAYSALQTKRATAVEAVTTARQLVFQATAQFAAGDPSRTVSAGGTIKLSPLRAALKGALTAFFAGLLFAGGIVLLLELRYRRRAVETAAAAAPVPDAEAAEPPKSRADPALVADRPLRGS